MIHSAELTKRLDINIIRFKTDLRPAVVEALDTAHSWPCLARCTRYGLKTMLQHKSNLDSQSKCWHVCATTLSQTIQLYPVVKHLAGMPGLVMRNLMHFVTPLSICKPKVQINLLPTHLHFHIHVLLNSNDCCYWEQERSSIQMN